MKTRPFKLQAEKWCARIAGGKPPAIVLGGSVNGLSFVRSLGRRGIPTLLLDTERLVGMYTRFGQVGLLPAADERSDVWIDVLEVIGSRLDAPGVLFVTSDAHGVLVAEHEDVLRRYFRFVVPGPDTLERIVNKRRQYEAAGAAGIPIPTSHFPESEDEVANVAGRIAYPCILKPHKAHVARKRIPKKVALVHSPNELIAQYRRLASGDVPFMVQEIIPGDDTQLYGYLAFWDADGRELVWLTKRKQRQNPPHYGDGSLQITVEAPEVAQLSRRLLKAFAYSGFVGVEFKYDRRDGKFKLMEINPRTVSGNQLAIAAGVDFPWIGYQYLTAPDLTISGNGGFRFGVKYVNEEWDLKAYLALRRSGDLSLSEWLRSVRGAEARAILAWDDPGPFAVAVWRIVRGALRRLFRASRQQPH